MIKTLRRIWQDCSLHVSRFTISHSQSFTGGASIAICRCGVVIEICFVAQSDEGSQRTFRPIDALKLAAGKSTQSTTRFET